MYDKEVGRYWEENAEAWTKLSRMGYDVYRDLFNTPAFLSILPDIKGLRGLDIGCGEGYNTRKLAELGAEMTAVDIAPTFIRYASETENENPMGIRYLVSSGTKLPFGDESFDFATAFMSLMDMASPDLAIEEAYRVLKPAGFFQFSICHPCTDTPHRKWVDNEEGNHIALEIGGYFEGCKGRVEAWIFSQTPPELRANYKEFLMPRFTLTLSKWFNLLIGSSFVIEYVQEPTAPDEAIQKAPHLADTRLIPHFLHIRCRKR
ncbi:class I SAM-dependent methyltransferase [candidate division WOR-3 bacterium]|nr:class I SAM-dependent methyltransferase [candidate division WOR-3 bacterium]